MPTSSSLSLAGQWALVDCGLGVTRGLAEQGLAPRDLSLIFVTHLHSDHYLELWPLPHTAWTAGRETLVCIWGPAGLQRYWRGFLAAMEADISTRIADGGRLELASLVSVQTLQAGQPISEGPR